MNRLQSNLETTLGQHAYLPAFLASLPSVRKFAADPPSETGSKESFNQQLEKLSGISSTLDIYLMRTDGETIASSNWKKKNTFIGKNFAFRPYFQQAIGGRPGKYFALGTASGERGYYFAYPVRNEEEITVGVIVVKVDISAIESVWENTGFEFMITDKNDVIFMSSRKEWQLKSLQPITQKILNKIYNSRRYSDKIIQSLVDYKTTTIDAKAAYTTLSDKNYLHVKKDIPEEDWRLHILADRKNSQLNLFQTFGLSSIAILLACSLAYLLLRNQHQKRMYEIMVRKELRKKIDERTKELKLAQEDLVQAAKMAALGELSAGINHELNNPLTAIRSYANNAVQFLDNGQLDIVRSNLSEINNLTETMAAIARQLKTFSRKSHGEFEAVDLRHALDSALLIIQPKLTRENVKFIQNISSEVSHVQADLLWLEQILVNILHNAIEAVAGQTEKTIWLTVNPENNNVKIDIRDNGPGIDESDIGQIFEAFFTTKDPGKGLGLGLSISYKLAIDMQGNITVQNDKDGGAHFSLTLPATVKATT